MVESVFGRGAVLVPDLDKADRVLTLDCDFLGLDPVGVPVSGNIVGGGPPKARLPKKTA